MIERMAGPALAPIIVPASVAVIVAVVGVVAPLVAEGRRRTADQATRREDERRGQLVTTLNAAQTMLASISASAMCADRGGGDPDSDLHGEYRALMSKMTGDYGATVGALALTSDETLRNDTMDDVRGVMRELAVYPLRANAGSTCGALMTAITTRLSCAIHGERYVESEDVRTARARAMTD